MKKIKILEIHGGIMLIIIVILAVTQQYLTLPIHKSSFLKQEFSDEYSIITAAALRNGCGEDNKLILFAIRKAENGPPGNEFGIKCKKHSNTNLDQQAACAAVTIMNNRKRWNQAGKPCDFIIYLANVYCPQEVDPEGHDNWIKNVTYWVNKFKENS